MHHGATEWGTSSIESGQMEGVAVPSRVQEENVGSWLSQVPDA